MFIGILLFWFCLKYAQIMKIDSVKKVQYDTIDSEIRIQKENDRFFAKILHFDNFI